MTEEFSKILENAVDVAVSAANDMEKAQMNMLLERLESEEGSKGVAILILHIMRQNARNIIGNRTASKLVSILKNMLKDYPRDAKERIREFLGLVKWLYEPSQQLQLKPENLRKPLFESYLQEFINRRK